MGLLANGGGAIIPGPCLCGKLTICPGWPGRGPPGPGPNPGCPMAGLWTMGWPGGPGGPGYLCGPPSKGGRGAPGGIDIFLAFVKYFQLFLFMVSF